MVKQAHGHLWPTAAPVSIHVHCAGYPCFAAPDHNGCAQDTGIIEVQAWGPAPAAAPTIVLLHEGLGCIDLWRDFPSRLAAGTGFGVCAYSRAGYGGSAPAALPRPLDYMRLEASAVLPQVLSHINFRNGWLLGHSDGASIASVYLGSVQDPRILGAVLIAPHFFTEALGLAEIEAARAAFLVGDLRARLARYHADADNAFRGWNDAWLAESFRDWTIEEVCDYVRVPVLAIQGSDDQYGTVAQLRLLEERLYSPYEECIITATGHSPHLQAQPQTLSAITAFLQRSWRLHERDVRTGPT